MDPLTLGLAAALGATSAAALVRARRGANPAPIVVRDAAPAKLALERPRPLPTVPPSGQDARELASFDGWVDHPGYAVTPQGILAAFREAERGYPQRQCDLIDDLVENDAHLRNLFEARDMAVAGKPWLMQADGQGADAELAARVLFTALRALPMIPIFAHLIGANRYGYAAAEIDWSVVNLEGRDWILPVALTPVPARRFRIGTGYNGGGVDELRLFVDPARPQGEPLRPGKWIVVRRPGGSIARAGLMRTAAWPAMGKRLGFRDWLIFSQRFGLPLPIASYDDTADEADIDVAEEIVKKIGTDGGAVKPDSIKVDLLDATRGGENSKVHGGLIAHCNAEMSKLINGSTLTNDNAGAGGASYALGEVHAAQRWENVVFDAELLQEAFRVQLAAPFVRWNNLAAAPPLLKIQVVRDLDPRARAEIAARLRNELGIPVSTSQLRQELGFREPAGDGDAAPGAVASTPTPPAGGNEP